jgi:ATP-dependent Lhr-like helicase
MMGRWSVIPKVEKSDNQAIVKILLNRYGILFKALVDNESLPLKWYDCVYELTRLEAQDKILAGRFVKSYSGIQFADKQFIKQKGVIEIENLSVHEKDCCYFEK